MLRVTFYRLPIYAQEGEAGERKHRELIAKMLAEAANEIGITLPTDVQYAMPIIPPEMLGQYLFRLDMQADEPLPHTLMGATLNRLLTWVRKDFMFGRLVGAMQVGGDKPWKFERFVASSSENRKAKP